MATKCESQVRLIAGVVILLSLGMGILWTEWAFLITGFVGVNLLQSSQTGLCPAEWMLPGCANSSQ